MFLSLSRSPVFRAMLHSGMAEGQKGRVNVKDAEPLILRKLLQYVYTSKLGTDFKDYKKLLILADKYQLMELVDYTSTKILEGLTKDNALELGIFGETYNSTILLNECAKYIKWSNTVEPLAEGWEKQLQGFPRLMLATLGTTRKEEGEVTEFVRWDFHGFGGRSVVTGQVDAIGFRVSTRAKLSGVGIYSEDNYGEVLRFAIRIYQGEQLLFEEEKDMYDEEEDENEEDEDRVEDFIIFHLNTAVELQANTLYDITAKRLSGPQLQVPVGLGGKTLAQAETAWVKFSRSVRDTDGTRDYHSQIPAIYLKV